MGRRVDHRTAGLLLGLVLLAALPSGRIAASPESAPQAAAPYGLVFELTSADAPSVDFALHMDVWYMYIIGGHLDGTICDAPGWTIRGGVITGQYLAFRADYAGEETCAASLIVLAQRGEGSVYSGYYVWDHEGPSPTGFICDVEFLEYIPPAPAE